LTLFIVFTELVRLILTDRLEEIEARFRLVGVIPIPLPAPLMAPSRPELDDPPSLAELLIAGRVPSPKAFRPIARLPLEIAARPMLDDPPNLPAELIGARAPSPKEFRAIPKPAPLIPGRAIPMPAPLIPGRAIPMPAPLIPGRAIPAPPKPRATLGCAKERDMPIEGERIAPPTA
jgi:hypothetical protein